MPGGRRAGPGTSREPKAGPARVGLRTKIRFALEQLEWRALRIGLGRCPLCDGRVFLRLSRDLLGTRCLRCEASPIAMAMGAVIDRELPDLGARKVYETSSRGPLFEFLKRRAGELTFSEFFDDVEPGGHRDGIPCQDVQQLTYPDRSFDLCTSTEVFEHVADDRRGFAELHRVLRPDGLAIFTVPIHDDIAQTVERARLEGERLRHLLDPQYHDDFIRGSKKVLVYRNYSRDITDRLRQAGFERAEVVDVPDTARMGCVAQVVVARKA
jgi:SAM-dependent methyltransferase